MGVRQGPEAAMVWRSGRALGQDLRDRVLADAGGPGRGVAGALGGGGGDGVAERACAGAGPARQGAGGRGAARARGGGALRWERVLRGHGAPALARRGGGGAPGGPARGVRARFGVSASYVVKVRQRLRDEGAAAPRPQRNRVSPRLAGHEEAIRPEAAPPPRAPSPAA